MFYVLVLFHFVSFCLVTAKHDLFEQTVLSTDDRIWSDNIFAGNQHDYHELEIEDDYYRRRNVSYFVSQAGLAIIDGDVVYGTEEELLAHRYDPNNSSKVGTDAFSVRVFWPDAKVKYKYDSDGSELLLSSIVQNAISRWLAVAPYLTFEQQPANSPATSNNVLTITANKGDGCHSPVGFRGGALVMNLQQAGPTSCNCCPEQATHEFGHTLGLIHEHQRPDRENFVHYQCANLNPACQGSSTMPPGSDCCTTHSGCCLHASNFAIINDQFNDDATLPYDINSIMHYSTDGFALPGKLTLTPANPSVIFPSPHPGSPSASDAQRICKLYRNWCPRARACADAGCPATCNIIRPCPGSPRCRDETPIPCCTAGEDNKDCRAQKILCSRKQCDFLLG